MFVQHQPTSGTKIGCPKTLGKRSIANFYGYCKYGQNSRLTINRVGINTIDKIKTLFIYLFTRLEILLKKLFISFVKYFIQFIFVFMSKFLIIGLGNPGNEYVGTRHNIGFDVLNAFALKHNVFFQSSRLADVAEIKFKGKIFVCIKPTTFMNLSGRAVKYWLDKEKIAIEHSLTIVDDLALPLSKLRLRKRGSDAGHNGLRDIQNILGTDAFPKLRFGIGNQFPKGMQVEFVLSRWLKEEIPVVKAKIEKSVEIIELFATTGIDRTMSEVNHLSF